MKNQGVHTDGYMLFDVHVNERNKKIMGFIMCIRRISDNFDKSTRILIVQTLVLSLMNCCISICKKLGAYADAARGLGAHLRDNGPGAHYPGTQGQSDNRVTTVYLPRQRGHNSLPDVAYLLTAR